MLDGFNKNERIVPEEQQAIPEEQVTVSEEKAEEQNSPQDVQDVPQAEQDIPQSEPVVTPEVEAPTEEKPEEPTEAEESAEEQPKVEEPKVEEQPDKATEPAVEPTEEEEQEEEEDLPTVEDFERVQAELEEIKIAEADRQIMQQLKDRDAGREQQLRTIEGQLADRLELELNRYGIDLNKSLGELQKEDPAKFQIAQSLINQSRAQAEQARAFMDEQKAADAREAIFNKAGMLMAKYDLAEDETNSVAETFLDIIDVAGVRDLGEDLKNKVELAVAKVRFVGGKLKKAVKETEEAVESVKDVAEAVKEVVSKPSLSPQVEQNVPQSEPPVEEEVEQPDKATEPVVTEEIKKEALAEAKGDAVSEATKATPSEGDGATVDNVLEKLMATPFKDRVEFYKKHEALINEARKIQLRNESMNNGFFD